MVEQFTQDQIAEFQHAFSVFDQDEDGTITIKELESVMKVLGHNPSREEIREMIKDVDTDNSGSIEFSEFLALMAGKMKDTDTEEELTQAFKVFDREGTGIIQSEYIKKIMSKLFTNLKEKDINLMLKDGDLDKKGGINYQEFLRMMMAQ